MQGISKCISCAKKVTTKIQLYQKGWDPELTPVLCLQHMKLRLKKSNKCYTTGTNSLLNMVLAVTKESSLCHSETKGADNLLSQLIHRTAEGNPSYLLLNFSNSRATLALASVTPQVGASSHDSIPGQGTYPCCRFNPQSGGIQKATN